MNDAMALGGDRGILEQHFHSSSFRVAAQTVQSIVLRAASVAAPLIVAATEPNCDKSVIQTLTALVRANEEFIKTIRRTQHLPNSFAGQIAHTASSSASLLIVFGAIS